MSRVTPLIVARAIAMSCEYAGRLNLRRYDPVNIRASRLVMQGYILTGDPHDWGGPSALVTIYMEPQGGLSDCIVPLSQSDDARYDAFAVAERASSLLPEGVYIEFVNVAVACVYRSK